MTRLSRRRLLRTMLVGGAAAAVGARRVSAADVSPEWVSLLAAAKKEGKVVVNTFPGEGYGRALKPLLADKGSARSAARRRAHAATR